MKTKTPRLHQAIGDALCVDSSELARLSAMAVRVTGSPSHVFFGGSQVATLKVSPQTVGVQPFPGDLTQQVFNVKLRAYLPHPGF